MKLELFAGTVAPPGRWWEAWNTPCLAGPWVGLLAKLLAKKSGIGLAFTKIYVFRMEGFDGRPGARAPGPHLQSGPIQWRHQVVKQFDEKFSRHALDHKCDR